MKLNKSLSNALDTDFEVEKVTDLVPVEENTKLKTKVAEDDFDEVRKTLKSLISVGNVAINDMHTIAQHNEDARSFEVLATLIKTVSETAEKVLIAHEKEKKMNAAPFADKKFADATQGAINVEKAAVFVGTTADLLKQLKNRDE